MATDERFDLLCADSGADGVALAHGHHPRMILLDVDLDGNPTNRHRTQPAMNNKATKLSDTRIRIADHRTAL